MCRNKIKLNDIKKINNYYWLNPPPHPPPPLPQDQSMKPPKSGVSNQQSVGPRCVDTKDR